MISLAEKAGKEIQMNEVMTDFQFKTISKMILDILKSSKDLEEATERIENILKENDPD